jgi:recombination protein RecT
MSESVQNLDAFRADRQQLAAIGNLTAKVAKGTSVAAFYEANKKAIADRAARYIDPGRMLKIGLDAIRENPRLAECTVRSLFAALIDCAVLGLEPTKTGGLVFLIPRKRWRQRRDTHGNPVMGRNGKPVWEAVWEVHVQVGYKGHIAIAYRSGMVKALTTDIIHANDRYEIIAGSHARRIEHRPRVIGNRGDPIVYYASAKLESGETIFEWMSTEDIEAHRAKYSDEFKRAQQIIDDCERIIADPDVREDTKQTARAKMLKAMDTPWIDEFDQMARKTLVNRIKNYLPPSSDPQVRDAQEVAARLDTQTRPVTDLGESFEDNDFAIDVDVDDAADQGQITHEVGAPTMPDLIKQKEKVTTTSAGAKAEESGHSAEQNHENGPDSAVAKKAENSGSVDNHKNQQDGPPPGSDLGGPRPWWETAKLSTSVMTPAVKALAAKGPPLLADAMVKPAVFWLGMPRVRQTTYDMMCDAMRAAEAAGTHAGPAQSEPERKLDRDITSPDEATHADQSGGFGDVE